jgi:phosphatidylinositol phosphate synthase
VRTEVWTLLAIVAIALLTMLCYRLSPAGRARGADASGRGGSFFLGFFVRDWFYWAFRPVFAAPIALGISPLVFNILGVAFGVAAGWALAVGRLPLAGLFVLLSGLADVIDGQVARGRNLASAAGAFLDSTLDRYSEAAVFLGAAWYYDSKFAVLLVVTALAGSLLVSYTRARGESLGVSCKYGVLQRAERMLLMALGTILDPTISSAMGRPTGSALLWVLGLMAIGTLETSIFRTVWITRRLGQEAE